MRAIKFGAYGGVENLNIASDAQDPDIRDDQLLIEVKAVSINPIDYKVREGYLQQKAPLQLPIIIGGDFSGIVKRVGHAVTGFVVGEQVYGQASVLLGGSGSFAELVAASAATTARKPQMADYIQSAALPLAGVSALQALEDHMSLKKSQKILIHGGAGGIGSIAIQIAKSIGAFVATTVSEKDRDFARVLGANVVLDYQKQKFEDELRDYDAVFDTVGGEITLRSMKVLRDSGVIVSMAGQPDTSLVKEKNITAIGQWTTVDTDHLNRLQEYVDSGRVKVHVDRVFPLDDTRAAFNFAEHNHPRGKVVVRIA